MGAPGYPPVTMFKIVLLQQWHTLSDPGAEEAVRQAEMTPANVHDSRVNGAAIFLKSDGAKFPSLAGCGDQPLT